VPAGERDFDRYEPLPGIARLPAWIWARMSRPARIAAGLVLLAGIALAVALAPGIGESKRERAQAEQEAKARHQADLKRRLIAESRPVPGRLSGAPADTVAARTAMLANLGDLVLSDARRRHAEGQLHNRAKGVECEPFPRTVSRRGAEHDLSRRSGRYSCLAVTSKFDPSESSVGGSLGYPYRAQLDFTSGRYAFCKVSGRPGEGGLVQHPIVTVPTACGGTPG
jgi:hypothetical protein